MFYKKTGKELRQQNINIRQYYVSLCFIKSFKILKYVVTVIYFTREIFVNNYFANFFYLFMEIRKYHS